jgi:hypothetical protein
MSNYLAIATVTAALQQVLQSSVNNAVGGATVGFSRPDGTGTGQQNPLVNIYLYQITPNAAYRNADLPTRRSDGTLLQRPQAAFDLHYVFTFHGNDDQLEPQRLLGAVASALHAQPMLSRSSIQSAVGQFSFLAGSGLEEQIEQVKFTPTALSLEEFSKLWSVFFQVEYNLSTAYQASVVLIQSDETPQESLPVQARNLYVRPFRWPQIERVIAQAGPNERIVANSILLIQGTQLRGDETLVLIDDQELSPTAVTDTQITLPLPVNVPAGVHSVQVLQKVEMGGIPPSILPTPHRGVESNVAPFVLHPTIVPDQATNAMVKLTVNPVVIHGQRLVLLLNERATTAPAAYTFTDKQPATNITVEIPISGVKPGEYFVRLQVDGAESPVELSSSSVIMVTIP